MLSRAWSLYRDIYGLELEGARYDTGDVFGFLKATIEDHALDREDLGPALREFMKTRGRCRKRFLFRFLE